MIEHRTPILGLAARRPLQCLKDECINKRAFAEPGRIRGRYFQCPNRPTCEEGAFCYPRFKRTKQDLDEYLKQRGLQSLPPHLQFHFHEGMDLGKMDDTIVSVVRGKVVDVIDEYRPGFGGYGKGVIIQASDSYGPLSGLYFFHGHCKEIYKGIEVGKTVEEQDPIAVAGNTDYSKSNPTSTFDVGKAHLHFEVSRWQRGKGGAFHDLPPEYKDDPLPAKYCEDPNTVLEQLGPWGATAEPLKLFFPNGQRVTPSSSEALLASIESQTLGGYFPVGANNFWHGGVHLFGRSESDVVAPFDGTIVAARLDEDPSTADQAYGHLNFVLMKHEIPKGLVERLAPPPKQAGKSGGAANSEQQRDPQAKVKVGNVSVGGPNNPPEYVVEVKRLLHGYPRPERRADGSLIPYYNPQDDKLTDPSPEKGFVDAIKAFQDALFTKLDVEMPTRSGKPRPRDGKVDIIPPGYTIRALRAHVDRSPDSAAASTTTESGGQLDGAHPSGDETAVQSTSGTSEVLYSLFMHLAPAPIDQARTKKVPWLARAHLPATSEEKAESERHNNDQEAERKEADRSLEGDVGPLGAPGIENTAGDVEWVKARLKRFGYLSDAPDADLVGAIKQFQFVKVMNSKPASKGNMPDGIVGRRGPTYRALAKAPPGYGAGQEEPAVNERFLAEVRKRSEGDTTKVVSGLNISVSAGEVVGTMGIGCSHNDVGLTTLVHWEMFSERPLMQSWMQLKDKDGNELNVDATEPVLASIEGMDELGDDEKALTHGEVATYFNSGYGASLRELQCFFQNEWSHSPDAVVDAYTAIGHPAAQYKGEAVKPYLFWAQAADVLPHSSKVWHYNPTAFLAEYARASGGFLGTLTVWVTRAGQIEPGIEVEVSAPGVKPRSQRTDARGAAVVRGLPAGMYNVSASSEYSTEGATLKVRIAPAEEAQASLELE